MNVIERIKQLRDDRGWSDYKLAEEALIPASTLSSIFARNTPPKLDILENICKAFGITLSQFFLKDEQVEIVNIQEKILLDNFRKLSPEKKNALITIIDK